MFPYSHVTGKHEESSITVEAADIIIVEGIHSLYPALLPFYSSKIFLYSTPENAKELRFLTDIRERRYTPGEAFKHAETEQKAYNIHILPYANLADIYVSVGAYWNYSVE